jgi:hypothetical protein
MNKRKSAVTVARKMVRLAWLLTKRRDMEHGLKLRYYKIKKMVEEAVSA